jgi:glyceraldehyde 3-phosphate dehydrogenase
VRHVESSELSVQDSFPVLEALSRLDIKNCHIDLGKLSVKYRDQGQDVNVNTFVSAELEGAIGQQAAATQVNRDVVLYGFGRIGRLLARILTEKASAGALHLRAIVVRKGKGNDILKRSNLLLRDSSTVLSTHYTNG